MSSTVGGYSPPPVVQVRPLGSGNAAPGNNIQGNTKPVNGALGTDGLGVIPSTGFINFNVQPKMNLSGNGARTASGDPDLIDNATILAGEKAAEKEELQTRAKDEEDGTDESRSVSGVLPLNRIDPFGKQPVQSARTIVQV